ncbi:MAG: hypothetical protein MJA83_02015 [Gammaproteobacteria bacterium]|nr:hypothetical protein [Gammaproteobacteria bacterium]
MGKQFSKTGLFRSLAAVAVFAGLFTTSSASANDISPNLIAAIRAQGAQAMQAIRAEVISSLHQTARTLDVPGVEIGPIREVDVDLDEADSEAAAKTVELDLISKTLRAMGGRGMHRVLVTPEPAFDVVAE